MIGFKKVPTKLVIGIFFLLIALVLLLYLDLTSEQPPAEEEIAYSEAIEGAPLEVVSQQTYEVKDGEILSIIFEKFKVPLNTQYKIYSLKEANLVTNIRPGNRIIFTYLGNELTNIAIVKDKLSSIEISIGQKIILNKVTNNIETISSFAGGTISSSFYEDASASGMPDSVIMDLAYIFGWDIDCVFDIRKGDTLSVIYVTPYSKDEMVENGDILIAEFTNQNKTYVANRFIDQEGKKGYFDNNGENLQKAFLRAPLEFSYISSHFNPNRMHPVLHTIRAHNGVDYAAPRGSPVRATGSGSVEFVGVRNGCGKEIVLKHTNDYSTRYCHLNKFESKVKKGRKIQQGQVIGYVGSTGLATGPHLHYEFKIGNKHTDPVKIKLPSAEPLSSKLKMDFDILFKKNKLMLDDMRKFSSKNENG